MISVIFGDGALKGNMVKEINSNNYGSVSVSVSFHGINLKKSRIGR